MDSTLDSELQDKASLSIEIIDRKLNYLQQLKVKEKHEELLGIIASPKTSKDLKVWAIQEIERNNYDLKENLREILDKDQFKTDNMVKTVLLLIKKLGGEITEKEYREYISNWELESFILYW